MVGIFVGLIVELAIDNQYFVSIEKELATQRLINEQLEQENKALREFSKLEIIQAKSLREQGKSLNEIAEALDYTSVVSSEDLFKPF